MDGWTDGQVGVHSRELPSALSYWQLQAQELSSGGRGVLRAQASPGEGFWGKTTSPGDQPTQSKVGGGSLGQTASAQPFMCSPVCSPPAFTESIGSDVSFLTIWGLVEALT